jgi:WD40 repeat protein
VCMSDFVLDKRSVGSFAQVGADYSEESDNGDYVFELDQSCDFTKLAASMSNHSITVCDSATLAVGCKIQAHADTINAIEFSKSSPFIIYSASSDSHVCLWDIRTANTSPLIKMKLSEEVTGLSVTHSDSLLAAGCENVISFYDVRGGSVVQNKKNDKLGEYTDIHSDMVTQLKFDVLKPDILTSASEDGLICVMNTSIPEGGEPIVSILNTECPVRRFGYFGENNDCILCVVND